MAARLRRLTRFTAEVMERVAERRTTSGVFEYVYRFDEADRSAPSLFASIRWAALLTLSRTQVPVVSNRSRTPGARA